MLKWNPTNGTFDYIRSIAWLDGRFVNVTGDTMTDKLTISMSSVTSIGLDIIGKIAVNGQQTIYNAGALNSNFAGSMFIGDGGGSLQNGAFYNMAIGNGALYSNTTGATNVAIGIEALYLNTTGEQNFALGFHSMYNNTYGQQNLGIGSFALVANTEGNYNLSIGNVSSYYNLTGIGNVAIGYDSGSFNKDWGTLTTNNYCVYIGYDSKGSANGNTNEIAIGFNVDGAGSNTATIGSPDVTDVYMATDGEATTRTIGIKTNTTSAHDLLITTGAAKTLLLNTIVYNDIYTAVAAAKIPAANYPDWSTFTTNLGSYTFKVDDYVDLSTMEILHGYKEGTDFEIHLHLATNGSDTNERKVKYRVYYSLGCPNTGTHQFSAEAYLDAELTIPANTLDKSAFYLSMGTISGTGMTVGCQIKTRIKRIAGTGTEPTNNPFLGMLGIHYQCDTIGSRLITSK